MMFKEEDADSENGQTYSGHSASDKIESKTKKSGPVGLKATTIEPDDNDPNDSGPNNSSPTTPPKKPSLKIVK